jgi:transposase
MNASHASLVRMLRGIARQSPVPFKGACTRGTYDNMKTAVETVFIGKDRQFNRRFLQMCGQYLVEPTACTPASGWEKGQSLPSRKRGSRTKSGSFYLGTASFISTVRVSRRCCTWCCRWSGI